jgi:hypothetical protein
VDINTPTDAIVTAMEHAEDMSDVVIIYKLNPDSSGKIRHRLDF